MYATASQRNLRLKKRESSTSYSLLNQSRSSAGTRAG